MNTKISHHSRKLRTGRKYGTLANQVGILVLFSIMITSGSATSQDQLGQNRDGCLGVISLSRSETRTTASSREFYNHQASFCREYRSARTSNRAANFGASYKFLSLSSGSSSMTAESLATRFCKQDGTVREQESAYDSYLRNVPGLAYDAYKACLRSASNDGIIFRHDGAMFLHNEFLVGVMFEARSGNETARVGFDASDGVNCEWRQDGEVVRNSIIEMDHSTQANIRCSRDSWNRRSTVAVYRTNGRARMALNWQPYDKENKPIFAMRDMQRNIADVSATVKDLRGELSSLRENGAVPRGTIAAFLTEGCPDHWFPADGQGGRPDLSGRFLIGSGPLTQDSNSSLAVGETGGAHRMRIAVENNQFRCCANDQGISGIGVEWQGEGVLRLSGSSDNRRWRSSRWVNHFPPFRAVKFCVKQ